MEIRILGPLEVLAVPGHALAWRGRQHQSLTAMLCLHANQVVSVSRLIDALWQESPPASAEVQVRRRISWLRQDLRTAGAPEDAVAKVPGGYLLRAARLDLDVFQREVTAARQVGRQGRPEDAAGRLENALALWRGPALAGLAGTAFEAEISRLEECRLVAQEAYAEFRLAAGQHRELVCDLSFLVAKNPLRERLRATLMLALYRSGRQAEALETYQQGRRMIVDELGLEPGEELRKLHQAMLRGDLDGRPEPVAGIGQVRSKISCAGRLARHRAGRGRSCCP